MEYCSKFGLENWRKIVLVFNEKSFINRNVNQCKNRYYFYLNPILINKKWTVLEEKNLLKQLKETNNKWMEVVKYFPNKTTKDLKNKYYLLLRRILHKTNKIFGNNIILNKLKKLKVKIFSKLYKISYKNNNLSDIENKLFESSIFFNIELIKYYYDLSSFNIINLPEFKNKFNKLISDLLYLESYLKNNKNIDNNSENKLLLKNIDTEKFSLFFNNLTIKDIIQNTLFSNLNLKNYINNIKSDLWKIKEIHIVDKIKEINF